MHELGHNLGLGHGGCGNINGKPNQTSVMNYVHSYRYAWNETFWRLTYSRTGAEEFASLDESQLDELDGIGKSDGFYRHWLAPFWNTQFPFNLRVVEHVTLDGFPQDFGSPDHSLLRDGALGLSQQDLKWKSVAPGATLPTAPSLPQVLHPSNDWNHLVVATRAMQGAAIGPPPFPTDELTWQDLDWINADVPKPPAKCGVGDFNCDGNVNGADLGVLLTEWGTCPGCQADLNRDGLVSGPDLGILLAAWGTSS